MPESPKLNVEQLVEDFKTKKFFGFIAFDKNEPAGMALCYLPYSTWIGIFIHLEDLYIRPKFRKFGLGKKFFQIVCNASFLKIKKKKKIQFEIFRKQNSKITNEFNGMF